MRIVTYRDLRPGRFAKPLERLRAALARGPVRHVGPMFDLIGGDLKAHMGHKVEVIGITSDTKLNNSDAFSSAIGSTNHEKATLTVAGLCFGVGVLWLIDGTTKVRAVSKSCHRIMRRHAGTMAAQCGPR